MNPTSKTNDWKKEWDELVTFGIETDMPGYVPSEKFGEKIVKFKQFINQTLKSQREEFIRELEGIIEQYKPSDMTRYNLDTIKEELGLKIKEIESENK